MLSLDDDITAERRTPRQQRLLGWDAAVGHEEDGTGRPDFQANHIRLIIRHWRTEISGRKKHSGRHLPRQGKIFSRHEVIRSDAALPKQTLQAPVSAG